jgi:hypothetical protein
MPDNRDVIGFLKHLEATARVADAVENIGGVAKPIGEVGLWDLRARVAIERGHILADCLCAFPGEVLQRIGFQVRGADVLGEPPADRANKASDSEEDRKQAAVLRGDMVPTTPDGRYSLTL